MKQRSQILSFYLENTQIRYGGELKFLIMNQLDKPISQIYSWNEILHVSDSFSVHYQKFFTLHTAMVYVVQVCWQLASRIRIKLSSFLILLANCQQTCVTYTTAVSTVKNPWWWKEKLSETRRVSFQEWIWEISACSWSYYKKFNTMRSHIKVKIFVVIYLVKSSFTTIRVHNSLHSHNIHMYFKNFIYLNASHS